MPKQRAKSLPEEQAAQKERVTQSKKERTNSRHTRQVEGSGRRLGRTKTLREVSVSLGSPMANCRWLTANTPPRVY